MPECKHRVTGYCRLAQNDCVRVLRSAQFPAFALIFAAALGLVLANGPLASSVFALRELHLGAGSFDLSIGHWVTDGLLAIFFFLAAVELKHELRHGELDSARKALVPSIAAVGGVLVPALIFLLLVPQTQSSGWPIPTATDIAFALGALALVGRALPARIRALLLALAVIDDLIAIAIIAFLFPRDIAPLALIAVVPVVLLFGWLSYRARSALVIVAMVVLALGAWALVVVSGIHPTIAGVALGLALASGNAERVRFVLEPWSNAVVLPLFAFVATLVVIPDLATTPLGPVFWAIVIAMPVGKIIGILGGALVARAFGPTDRVPVADLFVVAALGGIGFTVSLLMNELAFAGDTAAATAGTLGVLVASMIALVLGGTAGALRSRWYARQEG
jgi:NhaA family Na+:H+ antiporter